MISGKKFLVTGGAGFIGSHIVRTLLDSGASLVKVLDNYSTGFKSNLDPLSSNPSLHIQEGDIRNYKDCEVAVEGVEHVLHQAALGSVPRSVKDPIASHDVNVNGFLNMLHASKEAGVKSFVYASSSSVYGDHPQLPKVEDQIGKPLSPYALTKSANEQYARIYADTYGFASIGLRYFNVFGPGQSPKGPYAAVIPLFIKALRDHVPPIIHGKGEQTRDFTFISNAIEANLKASFADLDGSRVYNVACGENFSIKELFEGLKEIAGSDLEPEFGPDRAGDIKNSLADISLARKEIGYQGDFPFKEGLKLTWKASSKNITA